MEIPSKRFEEYVSLMAQSLGHADRVEPFRGYCTGLMLPVKRKSVEPMAAHLSPDRVRSEHQRLHHFVADAPWSDQAVLDTVRSYVLERISRRAGSPEALIIDDTGVPKKGKHSVGVARQYCGQLGNKTTARSPSASRSPMNTSVCRCATNCICRKAGPMTRTGVRLPKCPRRLSSSPSRCSRCNCLKTSQRWNRCPNWFWPTPVTGRAPSSASSSRRWASRMWSG